MGIGLDQPSHWVIIAFVALLLFGYKKMPEMARSAGRSLRIFKTEMKGMADDDDARAADRSDGSSAPAAASPPAIAPAQPATPVPYPNGSQSAGAASWPVAPAPVEVPAANRDPTAPPAS